MRPATQPSSRKLRFIGARFGGLSYILGVLILEGRAVIVGFVLP